MPGSALLSKHDKPLTKRQRVAVEALASGISVADTAALVNVSERTIRAWKTIPKFDEAVWLSADALVSQHRTAMAATLRKALTVANDALDAGDTATAIRLLELKHLAGFAMAGAKAGSTEVDFNHRGAAVGGPVLQLVFDDGKDDPALQDAVVIDMTPGA